MVKVTRTVTEQTTITGNSSALLEWVMENQSSSNKRSRIL